MYPLFVYGTLRHLPLLETVAGATGLAVEPATLDDHAIAHAVDTQGAVQEFPLFTHRPGDRAEGLLVRPCPSARARLDDYERAFGYDTTTITVQVRSGPVEAAIYLPHAAMWRPGAAWSLEAWAERWGAVTVETAAEVMDLLTQQPAEMVRARYRMAQMRAASRLRARTESAPASLRRNPGDDDVLIERLETPYARFFSVEEGDLRFRRFDGTHSNVVKRAAFVMADAVTVLPYDPVRDRVLLIEQFRFGPWARGDRNPWSLEPIAGRIDALETPEQAAAREAMEEAGLTFSALEPIGRYYPSPGAITEYLISYLGLADLPDGIAGLHGLDSEAEDIRGHLVDFERLMALVDSGEVANGPLLLTAHWLARHRERLRATSP